MQAFNYSDCTLIQDSLHSSICTEISNNQLNDHDHNFKGCYLDFSHLTKLYIYTY